MSIKCRIVILHNFLVREKANKIYLTISPIIIPQIHSDHSHSNKSHSLRLLNSKGRNQCLKQPKLIVLVLEIWSRKFDWRSKKLRVCLVDIWVIRKKLVHFILKAFHDFFRHRQLFYVNYNSYYKRMEEQPYFVDPNLFENTFNYAITRFPQKEALIIQANIAEKPFQLSEQIKKEIKMLI